MSIKPDEQNAQSPTEMIKMMWPDILTGSEGVQAHTRILQALLLSGIEPAFVHDGTLYLRAKNQFFKNRFYKIRKQSVLERVLFTYTEVNYSTVIFVDPQEVLDALWSYLILEIRKYNKVLYAVLISGVSPQSFSEDTLYVEVSRPWAHHRLNQTRPRTLVERVLRETLAAECIIKFELTTSDKSIHNPGEPIEEVRKDPIIRSAINIFDATIIAIDGEFEATSIGDSQLSASEAIPSLPTSQGEIPLPAQEPQPEQGSISQQLGVSTKNPLLEDVDALNVLADFLNSKGSVGIGLMAAAVLQHIASTHGSGSEEPTGLNNAVLANTETYSHDGLLFRSPAEIKIYDALKKRNVLFFPNTIAVLGGQNKKREPDFLICQEGKWGILEVMGDTYHPPTTAMKDHDRARLFKDYGLMYVEFYAAKRCISEPDIVVDDFLKRLSRA